MRDVMMDKGWQPGSVGALRRPPGDVRQDRGGREGTLPYLIEPQLSKAGSASR
jgi:hypothetical protein